MSKLKSRNLDIELVRMMLPLFEEYQQESKVNLEENWVQHEGEKITQSEALDTIIHSLREYNRLVEGEEAFDELPEMKETMVLIGLFFNLW